MASKRMAFRLARRILMISPLWQMVVLMLFHASTRAMTIPQNPVQEIAATTHFHLQFDGCFRPPRDPGFPTISHRTAVCAACIGICCNNKKDKNDDFAIQPLAVGARKVPVSIETTSQHAEYEGLLMGLEWLVEFLSNEKATDGSNENEQTLLRHLEKTSKIIVTVEGDCKTVIDQLTGKSNPRKLEDLHTRAQDLLEELQQIDNQFQLIPEISHIPRTQNSISDGLCNNLVSIIDATSWRNSLDELENSANQTTLEQQQQSSLSTVVESVIKTTKVSLRPVLYEMVAKIAFETKNHELLISIGERMIEEESSLQGSNSKSATAIRKTGVIYQILGWEGLKNAKKSKFVQRKYRVLLKDYDLNSDITEFPSWPKDGNCDKEFQIERLEHLGDVTEGEWDALPDVWKPILGEWFVSARHEQQAEEEEEVTSSSPVWVVHAIE